MENNKDNQNVKSNEEEALSKVVDAAFVKGNENKTKTRSKAEFEEEITSAYEKMLKLIDDKLSALRQLNIDPALVSSLTAQVKNSARVDFFNSVLNSDLDEIDKIVNSVATDSLKPILPDEHDESNPFGVKEQLTKQEQIMNYIAENVQKTNAEKNNGTLETKGVGAISVAPDWKDIIGSRNIKEAMKDMDKNVKNIVQRVEERLGIPIAEIQDERTAFLIRYTMSTLSGIILDEDGKIPEDAQNRVKSSMYSLAGREDEYTDKTLKVVSEMFGYNISDENGEIDRNKILELCDRMIYGDEAYEQMTEEEKTSLEKAKFDAEDFITKNLKREKEKGQDVNDTEGTVASDTKADILNRLFINNDDIDISTQALEAIRGDFDNAVRFLAQFDKENIENLNTVMRGNYDVIYNSLIEVSKEKGYDLKEVENLLKQRKESQDKASTQYTKSEQDAKSTESHKKSDEEKRSEIYSLILNGNSSTLKKDITNSVKEDIKLAVEIQKQLINHSLGGVQQGNYDAFANAIEKAKQEMFEEAFKPERSSAIDFEETITTLAEIDLEFVGKSMSTYLQENGQGTYDQSKVMRANEIIKSIAERQKAEQERTAESKERQDTSEHVLSANNGAIDNIAKKVTPIAHGQSTPKRNQDKDDDAR